jgi:hypothetical protein
MVNFNRDFLKEGKRYFTFPVDFLKAQTIAYCLSEELNHFYPILLLLDLNRFKTTRVSEANVINFSDFDDVIMTSKTACSNFLQHQYLSSNNYLKDLG